MTTADSQTDLDDPIDFAELAKDLEGIVCDYPYCDPDAVLCWVSSELAVRLTNEEDKAAPSLLIALHAASWYTVSGRIRDADTIDQIIEAVAEAKAVFEAGECPHPDGRGHPDLNEESPDSLVAMVRQLNDEEEWLDYYEETFAESEQRPGWLCPGFLAEIATQTLDTLREGRDRLFGSPDTSALDKWYLLEDGRIDMVRLTRDVDEMRMGGSAELTEGAAAWAARRLLDTARPEERLPLLLAVCFATQHAWWNALPPALVGLLGEALETVDLAPLAAPCPHEKGHPTADVSLDNRMRLARALYDPAEKPSFEVDEGASRCPRFAAEQAREMLDYSGKYLSRE